MSARLYKPVVEQLAETVSSRISRQVIAYLRRQTDARISGDDSGLKNSWEEFCVQVQQDESFYWQAFVDTVKQAIRGYLADLKPHEKQAVWLCSEPGWEWAFEHTDDESTPPILEDDMVESIYEKVHTLAGDYSNSRIRQYLESQYAD